MNERAKEVRVTFTAAALALPDGAIGTKVTTFEERKALKTCLYRHFCTNGTLLYVGISMSPLARAAAHKQSPWAYDIARIEMEWFDTRAEAEAAEREAIKTEGPAHNLAGVTRPPSDGEEARRITDDIFEGWAAMAREEF